MPPASPPPLPAGALPQAAFDRLLLDGGARALGDACVNALAVGLDARLPLARGRLLTLNPEPDDLATVLDDAAALLQCRAPDAALTVLDRVGPAAGDERRRWLLLQWQAARDARDHRRAALALQRLSQGSVETLQALNLPVTDRPLPVASALDLKAEHLEAEGRSAAAAGLLQTPASAPLATAERLAEATRVLAGAGKGPQALGLLPRTLDQAAAAAAWGLAGQLLSRQRQLELEAGQSAAAAATNQRRERLARRLEDGMGLRASLRSARADGTRQPALAQALLDRQEPLEQRHGDGLDLLLQLSDAPEADRSQARLTLAARLAATLDHRERWSDLLADQQRLASEAGDSWMLDRVDREALRIAAGRPLRELEALDRRLQELEGDPRPARHPWTIETLGGREPRRPEVDSPPAIHALPALLEDAERLRQARADGADLLLAPGSFGTLPSRLPKAEAAARQQQLEAALEDRLPEAGPRQQARERFALLVQRQWRRLDLENGLAAAVQRQRLPGDAVERQQELLDLERLLDLRSPWLLELEAEGRSGEDLASLESWRRHREQLRLQDRRAEARQLRRRRQQLTLQQHDPLPTAQQRQATEITQRWRALLARPDEATAAALQPLAVAREQETLELELVRLRLAGLLREAGQLRNTMQEELRLDRQLRSPLRPGGHAGPPAEATP